MIFVGIKLDNGCGLGQSGSAFIWRRKGGVETGRDVTYGIRRPVVSVADTVSAKFLRGGKEAVLDTVKIRLCLPVDSSA